jgi:hypothetical protein
MHEHDAKPDLKNRPAQYRRRWVAVLVITHLGLAFSASVANSSLGPRGLIDWPQYLRHPLDCSFGLQIGQIALLASWVAFANQHWLLRIPRFLALTAWVLFLGFLGEYVVEGESARSLVEEHSAYMLLQLFLPVAILFGIRAGCARQFLHGDLEKDKHAWQFNTRTLLLVTAELAALLALGRVVLPRRLSIAEFWTGLTENRTEEMIPALVTLTILPVVFFGLARQHSWKSYLTIGLYLALAALAVAFLQEAYLVHLLGPPPPSNWWPELNLAFWDYLCVHLSAAATILFTFYLLRRIGYDFRRRDEEPRGRSSSSKANSSAASASA